MSQNIWTQCEGKTNVERLVSQPWRVVESQHIPSTNKLVDSFEEQDLLEEMVERVKPPIPAEKEFKNLHYLLATPFRHPPLPYGSRFGTRREPGIWYGAESQKTLFAEQAYYRFVFRAGTAAELGTLRLQLSAFQVDVRAKPGVDLTLPPFAAHTSVLRSKSNYAPCQALGHSMREAGVLAFRYHSAREEGTNIGVFSPKAFAKKQPLRSPESWLCVDSSLAVEVRKVNALTDQRYTWPRSHFEVDGELPAPAA